ncbi:MAG: GGDEF domain-containing protein [Burkholderiaceae bacterium]|nr:GGDEF domain-containing protein [Burkholderiaceae bacterium]
MFFSHSKNKDQQAELFPLTDTLMDFTDSVTDQAGAVENASQRHKRANSKSNQLAVLKEWLSASGLIALYFLALGALHLGGLVEKSTLIVLLCFIACGSLSFFLIFKAKLHLRFREKQLKLPIISSSFFCMLVINYLDPAAQIIFAPFSFITLVYAMYRVPTRLLGKLVLIVLSGYAFVLILHFKKLENIALLKLELVHLFALALALPAFILQIGKVQHLHRILHRASRKIKYIQEDAKRDVLIDCFNRRYMVASLEEQKIMADENGAPFCLAVLDLDHFKQINDELGHLGGDEVLRSFSRIAQENIRNDDIFGRYGGEEFLLIFPDTSLLPALNTSERIRSQVEHFPWVAALRRGVSVSIGVTQYIPGESVLELFSRADTAMYLAKQGGRNQVVVEEPVSAKDEELEPADY